MPRYLIIGGPANGGLFEKEKVGEKYSLYAWDGQPGPNNIGTPAAWSDQTRLSRWELGQGGPRQIILTNEEG